MLLLVIGLSNGTVSQSSYHSWPSALTEGGPQFTR